MAAQGATAQLTQQLADGFDALLSEYGSLVKQHRRLEKQVQWAKQQHLDILKRLDPGNAATDHRTFLSSLEQAGSGRQNGDIDWLEGLSQHADDSRRTRACRIRQAEGAREKFAAQAGRQGVKIWTGPSADAVAPLRRIIGRTSVNGGQSPLNGKSTALSALPVDFTTQGTPSRLNCPFQKPILRKPSVGRSSHSRLSPNAVRSRRSSFRDPIQAEICGNDAHSTPGSADGSAAVCPIRFLDQHSPEEVAEYFEKHKHELPRSHELCVRRFQSNAEQIRQLDAKYGNLVTMIQGLGMKHQSLLPPEPDDDIAMEEEDSRSAEKVKSWAEAVSESLQREAARSRQPDAAAQDDEERKPHFDRPLKEIRVGESPSRPWGIAVPARYQGVVRTAAEDAAASPEQRPNAPASKDASPPPRPTGCPFDHTKLPPQAAGEPAATASPRAAQGSRKPAPKGAPIFLQHAPPLAGTRAPPALGRPAAVPPLDGAAPPMVFAGPVFIGYSPEQAMQVVRQWDSPHRHPTSRDGDEL